MTITTRLVTISFLSAVLAQAGPTATAPRDNAPTTMFWDPPANTWKVSGGVQYRQIGTLHWLTGSRAASANLPWLAGTGLHSGSSARIANGIGEHSYDDGFVNTDDGTLNDGLTSNYGFLSDSQLQGNNLSYHSASGGGARSSHRFDTSNSLSHPEWSEDLAGVGFFSKIESPRFYKLGLVELSATFTYSYVGDDSNHQSSDVFISQQRTHNRTQAITLTDRYDTTGLIMPQAPFTGTKGGSGYPLLENEPAARTLGAGRVEASQTSALLTSDVQESFDIKLHTLSLGLNIAGQFSRVRIGMGLGLGASIANWDASYEETVRSKNNVIRRFHDSNSGTEVLPGFYLEASAGVSLADNIDLFINGRYDWMGSLSENVGTSKFDLALGGWTAQGGLSVRF
jgi:hypothetical protein